jgi:dihydrofolate synthase/folylpolyglutamate synthase
VRVFLFFCEIRVDSRQGLAGVLMSGRLRLESLEKLGWRFGLQTIQALLDELGRPELSLKVVHVAGSNGKGSTCAFMASFLKHCGYKTGLYTSPHLSDIRERFRINGVWISEADFKVHSGKVLEACRKVEKKLGHLPTHFEALTAIAFSWFKARGVDWVVLEVGLGGRLDATNVIPAPALSLITPISLEHQNILGKRIEKIAWEKAGILKPGCMAASLQYDPRAASVVDRVARKRGTRLWLAGRDFIFRENPKGFYWEGPGLRAKFHSPHLTGYQTTNAALAVAGIQALQAQGLSPSPRVVQASISSMRWPGRMEEIGRKPLVVLDGAHNPGAARALLNALKSRYPNKGWMVLNGFLSDKNYDSFTRILAPITALSIVTQPFSERAEDAQKVFQAWERAGVKALLIRDWKKALLFSRSKIGLFPNMGLLVTGSLYLIGDCRKEWRDAGKLSEI